MSEPKDLTGTGRQENWGTDDRRDWQLVYVRRRHCVFGYEVESQDRREGCHKNKKGNRNIKVLVERLGPVSINVKVENT